MEFKTVAVSELEGVALNWAMAKVLDYKPFLVEDHAAPDEWIVMGRDDMYLTRDPDYFDVWSPCTDWSQCGPLIDKYRVELQWDGENSCLDVGYWGYAHGKISYASQGDTALIAACRAIVAAKAGDEIGVPVDLLGAPNAAP